MAPIIYYVGNFKLPDGSAAAQRVIVNGKLLKSLGYDVRYISDVKESASNHLMKKLKVHNINKVSSMRKLLGINYILNIICKEDLKNVHSIIAYNYPAIPLLKLRSWTKKNNVKIYSDCTEWYGLAEGNIVRKLIKFIDTEFRMRYLNKELTGVICISSFLQKYYSEKTVPTVLIPNLLDMSDSKWNINIQENIRNEIKLIYAGSPGKNMKKEKLDLLIEAFSDIRPKIRNLSLEIIGVSSDQYLQLNPNHKEILEGNKSIEFIGRIGHSDVLKAIRNSDFFIFVRPENKVTTAGFPTKLSEAFGCGIPVITNNTSDIASYLINGLNGFLLKTSSKEELIERLELISELTLKEIENLKTNVVVKNPFNYYEYSEKLMNFLQRAE
ncbi:glycosyltransferase family 4 protein [Sporosarcina sp. FA15]|uniref:glycosyltransferase family 4 protein n=1 Tax=Sporosarcina sp. FA15 TaxID=3413031 RepID=UPI003F65A4C5